MKKQGIFKNRWLLGSLSVVVGILLLLVVQPYVVGRINEQITVIRVKEKPAPPAQSEKAAKNPLFFAAKKIPKVPAKKLPLKKGFGAVPYSQSPE